MSETKIKALVVDDNEVNTMILASMLKLFGLHVDQIYSGEKAIMMLQKAEYDIVFIDHVMPLMDGVQTTHMIRSLARDMGRTVIFALTSNVTDDIRYTYRKAGANDVFTKPLGLVEVMAILKKWFPKLQTRGVAFLKETTALHAKKENLIRLLIENIDEINYEVALKYAIGNPIHYIHIVSVTIRDLQTNIDRIHQGIKIENWKGIKIGVHNLKSILSNIGAQELSDKTIYIETMIDTGEVMLDLVLYDYVREIENLKYKLENAIHKYDEVDFLLEEKQKKEYHVMSNQEYEQCLLNTIYYIKRYDYNSIIDELQKLLNCARPDLKDDLMKVLEDVKDFKYDNALATIIKLNEKR